MTIIGMSSCKKGILANTRLAAAVELFALPVVLLLPQRALAYPGEQMVTWARGSIVASLCLFGIVFFAIVVSIVVALARPQLAVAAVWVTVISLFLMYVMSNGATITGQLQSSS